jgi:hypothetical protein
MSCRTWWTGGWAGLFSPVRPHITMLQCFVRTADLDQVYTAAGKVLAAANVNAMRL